MFLFSTAPPFYNTTSAMPIMLHLHRTAARYMCWGYTPCFGGARYALWVFRMAQAASETAPAPAVMSYGMCYQGKCASQGISVVGICLVYCCSW